MAITTFLDEYSPELDITRSDALLDGGSLPAHVVQSELPVPDSWRPYLAVVCVVVILSIFAFT